MSVKAICVLISARLAKLRSTLSIPKMGLKGRKLGEWPEMQIKLREKAEELPPVYLQSRSTKQLMP
ncbi:hypothetical protein PCI56_13440 [Plesiomonas shigelloides subsp. oncorhynchi]|nr:hypothetical protein [Plesiomonas shigelloides]